MWQPFLVKSTMTKTEFINRVMLIMNEAGMTDVQGNSFLGADAANVDKYIESSYQNAWRLMATSVPKSWLTNVDFKNYPLIPNLSQGKGYIVLPKDFYMLSTFKMQGWQKPIFEAAVEDEKVSAIQSNPYTQGSIIRPVGTLSNEYVEDDTIISIKNLDTTTLGTLITGLLVYHSNTKKLHTISGTGIWRGVWAPKQANWVLGDVVEHNAGLWRYTQTIYGDIEPSTDNGAEYVGTAPTLNQLYLDGTNYYKGIVDGLAALNLELPGISQVLNYYTVQKGLASHVVEKAIYVPNVKPLTDLTGDEVIAVDEKIIEPMAYICAACVFTIFQKDQLAANLTERGLLMVPGYKSVKGTNVTIKQ